MSIAIPPRYAQPQAKAMLGPGAAAMMTQPMLSTVAQSPQKFMRAAAGFWKSDWTIRAAERVISGKFSTVDWHLEDGTDTTIDDQYPDQRYQVPRMLIEQPQAALAPEDRQVNASTRRELWAITARHMGVCGAAFHYLDQLEGVGKTPLAVLYIAPWRMWPSFTKNGNLTGWVLDWDEDRQTGTPLALDQVLQFNLEPPDEGAFAPGLIASAMSLLNLNAKTLSHLSDVLTAGGRLAGVISPKTADASLPDDKFQQLVRDFRTINELPDAARRTNILQGPVDFNRTAATSDELQLIDVMAAVRDDLLALEGMPWSQLGGSVGTGLNSGDVRKYDEAALWQNAIHQRLVPFQEKMQYGLLDRYKALGVTVELEIDEPEFDDDGPRYDLLAKSVGTPLRSVERRALIGLEPFGDPARDNAVIMPDNYIELFVAPDAEGRTVQVASEGAPEGPQEPVEASEETPVPSSPAPAKATVDVVPEPRVPAKAISPRGAAIHAQLTRLRTRMTREHTKPLEADIARFLEQQRIDIAARLRTNPEHVAKRPSDHAAWFAQRRWDRELTAILARPLTVMAQNVNEAVVKAVPVKAAPVAVVDRAIARGAARVTGINERTRKAVQGYIVAGIAEGRSAGDLADDIEAGVLLDNGSHAFDALRAETIARTEITDAYNAAALASYEDLGATQVQAIDGDDDEVCAERDGEVFGIDEAQSIEDHPNGTLDWIPVIEDEPAPEGKAAATGLRVERSETGWVIDGGPRPSEPGPTPMRIEYDEAGRIARLVPEGNEPDLRLEAMSRLFAEAMTAERNRPIVVQPSVMPAPVVRMEAPVIPAPVVHVEAPKPSKTTRRINRNKAGDIESIEDTSG